MSDANPVAADPAVAMARERTTLAGYRTKLALDRTTLAWVRTTLTMASFGFGMVAFFRSKELESRTAETVHLHHAAVRFGAALLILGIVSTVIAGISHWILLRKLQRGETLAVPAWPLSIMVTMLVAFMGLAGLWALFLT
jgi:putative membrane protein